MDAPEFYRKHFEAGLKRESASLLEQRNTIVYGRANCSLSIKLVLCNKFANFLDPNFFFLHFQRQEKYTVDFLVGIESSKIRLFKQVMLRSIASVGQRSVSGARLSMTNSFGM
jgi:hypothetical protein